MAVSTRCWVNLIPHPPTSTSQIPTAAEVARPPTTSKERSWKSRCVLGLTCAMIGAELDYLVVNIGDHENRAVAGEMVQQLHSAARIQRWSDKRSCQPWRVNSLETIVPENLPRPTGRRRLEAIDFSKAAPPLKIAPNSGAKSCFIL